MRVWRGLHSPLAANDRFFAVIFNLTKSKSTLCLLHAKIKRAYILVRTSTAALNTARNIPINNRDEYNTVRKEESKKERKNERKKDRRVQLYLPQCSHKLNTLRRVASEIKISE